MDKWVSISIAAAVLLAAGVAAFFHYFPNYSHRYRLTVEVEINNEIKTGTGVVTVSVQDNGPLKGLANGMRFHTSAWGQAPVVDLGEKGLLVAVLYPTGFPDRIHTENATSLSFLAFIGPRGGQTDAEWERKLKSLAHQSGARALFVQDYPGFVWIPDPSDPQSARPVDPNDIASVIDPSLRIKSVTVEITHDTNDNSIFKKLPWLETLKKDEADHGTLVRTGEYSSHARQFLGD